MMPPLHPDALHHLAVAIEEREVMALSIRPPWPHYIFTAGKDVENRKWPTRVRDWVLVHAGVRADDGDEDYVRELALPMGGVVGAVKITDCVTRMDSEWFCGPYGFVLGPRLALPLVPCRGALGFFWLEPEALAAVAAEVRRLAP